MSDDAFAAPEPNEVDVTRAPRSGHFYTNATRHELSRFDLEVVHMLIDERYSFDCDVIAIDDNTWAIHGPIPYGGEVILAEFNTEKDAEVALELLSAAEERNIDD